MHTHLIQRLPRYSLALLLAALLTPPATSIHLAAQSPPPSDTRETLARVTALRDAFVTRVHAAGLTCPIAAPTIVIDHVPSFGNYDDATNTLHTASWSELDPEEKSFFLLIAGPNADEAAAHANFEDVTHRWIFVHELGHWWQACQKSNAGRRPYAMEFDADRIDMAYWREVDPTLGTLLTGIAQQVLDHAPDPVPSGHTVEDYFNTNYNTLGPTPAYRWFQARMIVTADHETPHPTFSESLHASKR